MFPKIDVIAYADSKTSSTSVLFCKYILKSLLINHNKLQLLFISLKIRPESTKILLAIVLVTSLDSIAEMKIFTTNPAMAKLLVN